MSDVSAAIVAMTCSSSMMRSFSLWCCDCCCISTTHRCISSPVVAFRIMESSALLRGLTVQYKWPPAPPDVRRRYSMDAWPSRQQHGGGAMWGGVVQLYCLGGWAASVAAWQRARCLSKIHSLEVELCLQQRVSDACMTGAAAHLRLVAHEFTLVVDELPAAAGQNDQA
jgi:hypothetical protein